MSEAPPRVSVVIPVYNGERYVGEALGSVLRQEAADLEVIVSDNASTDRTLEIVDRAYVMNTGLIESQGTPQQLRAQADIEGIYMGIRRQAGT